MDFNFGNLVGAAVGAVVKVAVVIVNAMAEDVLGASAAVTEAREDGELSDEQAEELFEEKFKALLGASILEFGSGSSDSNSDTNEEDKTEPTFWSKTFNLGRGVVDVGKDTVVGLIDAASHPIDTMVGLDRLMLDPNYAAKTAITIGTEIKDAYKRDVTNGDANSESYFTGRVLGEVALLFGGEFTKIGKVGEVSKAEKAAETARIAAETARVAEEAAKEAGKADNFAKEPFLTDEYYKNVNKNMDYLTPAQRLIFKGMVIQVMNLKLQQLLQISMEEL